MTDLIPNAIENVWYKYCFPRIKDKYKCGTATAIRHYYRLLQFCEYNNENPIDIIKNNKRF